MPWCTINLLLCLFSNSVQGSVDVLRELKGLLVLLDNTYGDCSYPILLFLTVLKKKIFLDRWYVRSICYSVL